jgi:LemA protein
VKKNRIWLIVGGIFLLLVLLAVTSYNTLVKKEEKVSEQWAEVQNTYQRRLDLVPSLVNTVKGVSAFEQSTLEKIALLRSRAEAAMRNDSISGTNYERQKSSQDSLAAELNRLIFLIEAYPELRSTTAYSQLQSQLEGTERRIAIARQDFNASVQDYNQRVRRFPANLFASLFGFGTKEGFRAERGAEKAGKTKF